MKKYGMLLLAGSLLVSGCAQKNKAAEANQNLIRENEQRLASLENSVTALNSQIAQLNNRVYEVRTRNGQKTSMTVVPIIKDNAAPASALPAAKAQPVGKKVEPAPKPQPAKAKTEQPVKNASGSLGRPEAGPTGKVAASSGLDLPPVDLPPTDIPPVPQGNVSTPAASQGNARSNAVPVPQGNTIMQPVEQQAPPVPMPLSPTSDLSLPPEDSNAAATPAKTVQTEEKTRQNAPARRSRQGEQAAYNNALNAARSGRTSEGIRLFRDFLQQYPNGPYAANAEYWIGECLYAQGKYSEALSEFQNVNNSFPSHHKNADALLKAGITMSKMGDKDGAAQKFHTLISNFPNSEAARRARALGAK